MACPITILKAVSHLKEKKEVTTTSNMFLEAICNMDTLRIISILRDERYSICKLKTSVIKDFEVIFYKFKCYGDTELTPYTGSCKGQCQYQGLGYTFVGNNSNNFTNILFSIENDKIEKVWFYCEKLKPYVEQLELGEEISPPPF